MTKHGATVDMKLRNMGDYGGLYVDKEYIPFLWDNKNIYYNIEKPTEEDLEELEIFDLNSPTKNDIWETSYPHQMVKKKFPSDILIL